MTIHGYVAYTRGCHCDVCRRAKADYQRDRRAAARASAADKSEDRTFKHGTRSGYEERGCRCWACRAARAASDRETQLKRKARR
jgi:hypothetical protein